MLNEILEKIALIKQEKTELTEVLNTKGEVCDESTSLCQYAEICEEVMDETIIVTPEIDETLTVEGAGADAKVTGEKISNLQDQIDVSVKTVNDIAPDDAGNVTIDVGVKTVNDITPDDDGNVTIDVGVKTVNDITPDDSGNVTIDVGGGVGQAGTGNGAEIFNDYTYNKASGEYSHSEGCLTSASGSCSHAEGHNTNSTNIASHAEGKQTYATGESSHAEGYGCIAQGNYSHAEGYNTKALGENSHAEGYDSKTEGAYSHAEGYCCIAQGSYSHAQGKYNIEDTADKYAHIVGNGNSTTRSNAHTIDWDGNGWFAGNVKVGGTSQDDEAAKTIVTSVNGNVADESGNVNIEISENTSVNTTCFTKESIANLYNTETGTVYCDYEGNIVSEVTDANWITMWNPATKTLTLNTNATVTAHQTMGSFVVVPYLEFNDISTTGLLGLPLYLSVADYVDGTWSIASSDVIGYVGMNSSATIRKPCIQIWQANVGVTWGFYLKKYDGTFMQIPIENNTLVLCL